MVFALDRRVLEPELMDDPGLDAATHHGALRGLARLNWWSGAGRVVWRSIRRALPDVAALTLLDVACGSADVSLALVRHAAREGVAVTLTGVDISDAAVAAARARAARLGVPASFQRHDIEADPAGDSSLGRFDVVLATLFLHHMTDAGAVTLLGNMHARARRRVVVDDLVRGRFGYLLAATAPRILSRSRVVHTDARLSVRAAFTEAEARNLAAAAGLEGVSTRRHWPARFLLTANGAP
jgi:2-polyprenyl-3-methyl-5-hydroxy-6-metoxy-1,4-benzoquinol methylase